MAQISNELKEARELMVRLDEANAWVDLQAKDIPVGIVSWVGSQLVENGIEKVRKDLGIHSANDPRWKKIMQAMKSGVRVDSTALFMKWMGRHEKVAEHLYQISKEMLENNRPNASKIFGAVSLMSALQERTVKMGKELGVFADPSQGQGQGGGGVTIVIQSNIPHPSKEEIVVHQAEQKTRNADLLAKYKPKDAE